MGKNSQVTKKCICCGKDFNVIKSRANTAKYCCKKCADQMLKSKDNVECLNCGKTFHLKKSNISNNGNCCSKKCFNEYKKISTLGENNSNYKGRSIDCDGYALKHMPSIGRVKLHIYLACNVLGINKIPKNHHVHHRDCDKLNNDVNNLVVLTQSDHQWLHKQFGSAGLWAYYNNKLSLEDAILWSNDKEKCERLLTLNVNKQKEIGVFKSSELLESSEVDNQQPS